MTYTDINKEFALLERKRLELLDKLSASDNETLNKKPGPDAWSVIQVIDHMINIERSITEYISKKIKDNAATQKTGFKQMWRSFLLNRFLRSSRKFNSPLQVVPTVEYASLNQMRERWNAERSDLKALLNSIPENLLSHNWFKHPSVGKLNIMQMLTFTDAHHTHHMPQISRTLSEVA